MRFWFRSAAPVVEHPTADAVDADERDYEGTEDEVSRPLTEGETLAEADTEIEDEVALHEPEDSAEFDSADDVLPPAERATDLSFAADPIGRIRAEELPSAADALAAIFPEIREELARDDERDEDLVPTQEDEDVLASAQQTPIDFSAEEIESELRAAESATPARTADDDLIREGSEPPQIAVPPILSTAEAHVTVPSRSCEEWALEEKLASHREWIDSRGTAGRQANLSGCDLEGAELIGVNLRFADLHDAKLKGADLLLADLRDANLVRANLDDCCLVGTNLEGANLEDASLVGSMGLVPRQVAGTNLRDAVLPESIREFEHRPEFERAAGFVSRYFAALAASCAVLWLLIWRTSDAQLLTDSAVIPFLHSHAAAAALPSRESYLILPLALFSLYLMFEFQLQRLCDATLLLPATFSDGHALAEKDNTIIRGLLRAHFRWMSPEASSTGRVEEGAALVLAHWIAPLTLFLFWARYLTVQELHGSLLHALLFAISTGVAVYASTKIGRPAEDWMNAKGWAQGWQKAWRKANPLRVAGTILAVLLLLSIGTAIGVPHGKLRAPRYGAASIRRWAATALWAIGIDPYADVTEAAISARPANGPVPASPDDDVAYVAGAKLNNVQFRYAQAYRASFINAHLYRTDFQGAFLSEADFRGADLSQADLHFAVMDGTLMSRANFDRANLDGADLARADLRKANMPYASLANATLTDARLTDTSLYSANLALATMTRTNLERADLRDAQLGMAHMSDADLRGAYLWSAKLPGADLGGAQLNSTILIDADLRGVNLSGAHAAGAVFTNANLSGADLDGADLRGASGLTSYQLCSAKTRYGALLDDALETLVDAKCGGVRSH